MLEGMAARRLDRDAWEICLIDYDRKVSITMEFKEHKFEHECHLAETTFVPRHDDGLLRAIAKALQEIGIMPETPSVTELKATKYHLEDMRRLVFSRYPSGRGEGG